MHPDTPQHYDYDVGVKSPRLDAYGLFRAAHFHNPAR